MPRTPHPLSCVLLPHTHIRRHVRGIYGALPGIWHALASVHACTHSKVKVKSGSAYMYKASGTRRIAILTDYYKAPVFISPQEGNG